MSHLRARALSLAAAAALALGTIAIATPASASGSVELTTSTAAQHPASKTSPVKRWAAKRYGTFAARSYSGNGDAVVSLPKGAKAGIVRSRSRGDGNFIVWTLNRNNSIRELVANGIGDYTASMAFGLSRTSTATQLRVQADGDWTLTVSPVSSAGSVSGSHAEQGVFLYGGRAARLATKNDGSSNFIVWQHGSPTGPMNLVVNVYGNRSATGPLYRGPSVLAVQASGDWSASIR